MTDWNEGYLILYRGGLGAPEEDGSFYSPCECRTKAGRYCWFCKSDPDDEWSSSDASGYLSETDPLDVAAEYLDDFHPVNPPPPITDLLKHVAQQSNQIDDLESQVENLEGELSRLKNEVAGLSQEVLELVYSTVKKHQL